MAPALSHPPGATFIEHDEQRPINVDASAYYGGGGDVQSRSRTYSHVRGTLFCLVERSGVLNRTLVSSRRTPPEATARLPAALSFSDTTDVS